MFGLLMGESGIWYSDDPLDTLRLLLIAVVELPATALLYVYLRQLAGDLRDVRLRASFNVLALAVPACVGLAVVLMLLGDAWRDDKDAAMQQAVVAAYGAACITLGVVATAAVCRMALTLLPATLGDPGGGASAGDVGRWSRTPSGACDWPRAFARPASAGSPRRRDCSAGWACRRACSGRCWG